MSISQYYKTKLEPILITNENKIYTEITRLVTTAYNENMQSDEGYCYKFKLPIMAVTKFYDDLKISPDEVSLEFQKSWGTTLTHMHKDPYYQILLLIFYHAIVRDKMPLAKNTLLLIFLKIWNGRKSYFLKYCDKRIMKYVVDNMLTNRHTFSKYDNPISFLKDYCVPTMIDKYGSEVKKDALKLKNVFEQAFARIFQRFYQNPKTNYQTGKNEAQAGILPLYMKAREEGLYISAKKVSQNTDEKAGFDEYTSTHARDEIISKTINFMVMNSKMSYPTTVLNDIKEKTNVASKVIATILQSLNKSENFDVLQSIIILILSRTDIQTAQDICSKDFTSKIKRNIIGSKNNVDKQKLDKLLNFLLEKIFKEDLELNYFKYSDVYRSKIRNVIIYGLEYNLFRVNCRGY